MILHTAERGRVQDVPLLTAATAAELIGHPVERPPVRIVHIGLGAFHRAHQLWYTAAVDDENQWGVLAFTGRSPDAARTLAAQDGLFTLVERSEEKDTPAIIPNLVGACDGNDLDALATAVSSPEVVIVTLTITESGYRLDPHGDLDDTDEQTRRDLDAWTRGSDRGFVPPLATPLARLAYALDRRRLDSGAPIAIVPCDNLPDNGRTVRAAMIALTSGIAPELAAWLARSVSFVSTVVDRITPATTAEDIELLERSVGYRDRSMVVTEPFSEWILSGSFPAGRPWWERAGARIVEDVGPYERRKLWFLNGAHTLLATTARQRGHTTVADAMADPIVRHWVDAYWDQASEGLREDDIDLRHYRHDLLQRFGNSRIVHRLDQIATGTLAKLRIRAVPVVRILSAAGPPPDSILLAISGWIAGVLSGRVDADPESDAIASAASSREPAAALLRLLDPHLADDPANAAVIARQVAACLAGHDPNPASLKEQT
ncbi:MULTISPECIES: mannitol dehydrogenase family protein [unclassified Microbacterium]|uniref:mannitol dehydrogenase family protein n=1 Tax=unclassified Microbacterium TaxID=2609290 RepID=UPI00214BC735|nr:MULTISPECIES: mannitol dehydrogenase family protein [unclassified Microbacterium]MCR2811141.1 mannitol dehydrogenase family protein [Microbacterium sp. zg.B185]WIM20745.1 mannitol dehydrogenase family protein [Microbacterium sp. zg-B185]